MIVQPIKFTVCAEGEQVRGMNHATAYVFRYIDGYQCTRCRSDSCEHAKAVHEQYPDEEAKS